MVHERIQKRGLFLKSWASFCATEVISCCNLIESILGKNVFCKMADFTKFDSYSCEICIEIEAVMNSWTANRYDACLDDVADKVYTRDIFKRD